MAITSGWLWVNNGTTTTTATITTSQTTLSVASGSIVPTSVNGTTWRLMGTLETAQGVTPVVREIVEITGGGGTSTLTVVRAQEGTSGYAFPSGSTLDLRLTAGQIASFAQIQSGAVVEVAGELEALVGTSFDGSTNVATKQNIPRPHFNLSTAGTSGDMVITFTPSGPLMFINEQLTYGYQLIEQSTMGTPSITLPAGTSFGFPINSNFTLFVAVALDTDHPTNPLQLLVCATQNNVMADFYLGGITPTNLVSPGVADTWYGPNGPSWTDNWSSIVLTACFATFNTTAGDWPSSLQTYPDFLSINGLTPFIPMSYFSDTFDVTSSRTTNTVYSPNWSAAMEEYVEVSLPAGASVQLISNLQIFAGSVESIILDSATNSTGSTASFTLTGTIPVYGAIELLTVTGSPTITKWYEMR